MDLSLSTEVYINIHQRLVSNQHFVYFIYEKSYFVKTNFGIILTADVLEYEHKTEEDESCRSLQRMVNARGSELLIVILICFHPLITNCDVSVSGK